MPTEEPKPYVEPQWIARMLHDLERKIEILKDRAMKHTVIVEVLETLAEDELVDLLSMLCERATGGSSRARALHQELALEPSALSMLPYPHIKKSYSLAAQRGNEAVMGLFMGDPLRGSPTVEESFTGNDYLDSSLGQRKSAARSSDRFVLDRLLHDRNIQVITLLLENPRIVERDVVRIAALRPTRPEILQHIATHRRWASRYHVRKALVVNPYTPHQVARRLLSTLLVQDIKDMYSLGALPAGIRSEVRRILEERARLQVTATGATDLKKVLRTEKPEESLAELAQACLSFFDFDDETATAFDTTTVGEDPIEEDEMALLIAQAEQDLLCSVLVEVSDDEPN